MTEAATLRSGWRCSRPWRPSLAADWVTLVENPPVGRTVLAVICAVGGAAALAAIASRARPPPALLAAGRRSRAGHLRRCRGGGRLPARLLLPAGWGELRATSATASARSAMPTIPTRAEIPGRGWCCWRPSARCWPWRRAAAGSVAWTAGSSWIFCEIASSSSWVIEASRTLVPHAATTAADSR